MALSPLEVVFRDIHIKNVTYTNAQNALTVRGLPEQNIGSVFLGTLDITAEKNIDCQEGRGPSLKDIIVQAGQEPLLKMTNVTGLEILDLSAIRIDE